MSLTTEPWITYSSNTNSVSVTMAQQTTIHNIAANAGRDAIEVVEHRPSQIVEVYVGKTWRHHVEADGTIWLTEKNVWEDQDDYDWQAVDVEDDEPDAESLHEFKLPVDEDQLEVGMLVINGDETIAYAQLGAVTVSIGRHDGKIGVEIDDTSDEPVEVSINAHCATADVNNPIPMQPWNAAVIESPCNCESMDCKHPYMSVPAGLSRAMYIGAICDECAKTCMAEYLT